MSQYIGNDPQGNLPVRNIYATNKNYIINPTFSVNQRVFAGGAVTNGNYLFDRWNCRLNGAVSVPDANGFVTISTFATDGGLRQKVEDFGFVGDVTVSWEGTSLLQYYDANSQVWSTPAASPVTFSMVAAGASETDVAEQLLWGNGTLKNVKLELGSVVTPFEYPTLGEELAKCQRYYTQSTGTADLNNRKLTSIGAAYVTGTAQTPFIPFPVEMRTEPTLVFYPSEGGSTGQWNIFVISSWSAGNVTTVGIIPQGFGARVAKSGLTIGDVHLIHGNYTADAEL